MSRRNEFTANSCLQSLPLGWEQSGNVSSSIGFLSQVGNGQSDMKKLIEYTGDGHLMTLGPTGSGKSRGCAIPALLSHKGPAIVVDVKGELYNTTARHRRDIGQTVFKLDPWGVVGDETDSLNPLDLLKLPGADMEEEANVLSKLIAGPESFTRDKFWDNTSEALNAGLLAYLASSVEEKDCRLSHVREMLCKDFSFHLATLLDAEKVKSRLAREEFSIFLQHPERETRPSVQSSAQQHFRLLGTEAVSKAMDSSSIPLEAIIEHKPVTVYLVVPPHKLESHGSVLRIWLGVFLQAISRRQGGGEYKTLFLVDEAASLGAMEPLKRAITLLRGYSTQVWTLWQDASQIQANYPNDWQTIVNNAGVIQLLGPRNHRMAEEYASLVGGLQAETLLDMGVDHQVLLTDQQRRAKICQRMDYLHDSLFVGSFDSNPLFHVNANHKIEREVGMEGGIGAVAR